MARKGKMYEKIIDSKHLKDHITIKIYEPEQFDSIYENNVCIMQDGDDYFQIGRIATLSDRLHEDGDIINTTFIGIPYLDRFDRWKKYHPDGEQFEAYKLFVYEEVLPLIDDLVPINPLGTKLSLLGDSLGGTISLMIALDYPQLFKNVIMQSPYVDDTVLEVVEEFAELYEPDIYHTYGAKEVDVPTTKLGRLDFVRPNEQLVKLLDPKFTNYIYEINPEGNHTWKYWQQELPDILAKVFV
ncbi:MAG TPA: alpha/beta hydrolase-fold protein [Pseudogracilibacillus sp.]|nr:alpha/beta hydrolase-fold protein [Pseudogracilibacillus sp.]